MIRTFTTRLRATLTAVGLVVAAVAQPGQAADGPAPLPLTQPPSPGTVIIQGPNDRSPAVPGTVIIQGPTTVVPPSPGMVVHEGATVAGEQILSGGLAYLNSGSCGPGCTSSMAYLKVDYLHLWRDIDNERTFINSQFPDGTIVQTRIGEHEFDASPALRVTYGQALIEWSACDLFLEATYFGLHHSNIERSTAAFPGVTLFGSPLSPLFDETLVQTFSYVSDLHSGEVNLKWDYFVDNTLYYLLGVRYIRFDDRLKIREAGVLVPAPAFLPQAFEQVRVTNNLIGLQIGFDWNSRDLTSRWNFSTYGRAGLYANILDGETEQGANASVHGPFLNEIHPGRLQASGAIELGFVSSFRVTPNMLLRGGYHLLWLGAIGLAPDQPVPDLQTGDFNGRLSNNQDVLFHGPFVGLEYHWGCCR